MILNTFLEMAPATLCQSMMFAGMAIAISIPFRFLGFSDISSEGSFLLGGALTGSLILAGFHPLFATLLSMLGGSMIGYFTGWIHLKLKINPLLCGVLVITMMYSIALRVMGKPNLSLIDHETLFSLFKITEELMLPKALFLGVLLTLLFLLLLKLFQTQFGLRMRAVGSNSTMAQSQGISVFKYTLLGLALANSLAGLSGSLVVQSQGYSDANMGFGILMNSLASMMLGELLLRPRSVTRYLLSPILGSLIFFQISAFVLALGLEPSDLKFFSGSFVLLTIAVAQLSPSKNHLWPAGQR